MGRDSKISWTDHTFNPVWGCTKVSEGCRNCYAEGNSRRWGFSVWGPTAERRIFGVEHWSQPIHWNAAAAKAGERRRVFCGSMCDICEDHPVTQVEVRKLWLLIRATPWLDWLLLTKRPERYWDVLPFTWTDEYACAYANVWLGTSIEDIRVAQRADALRQLPAVVRWISYEPALGPLDALDLTGIQWVIYGGESGPGYRRDNPDWARAMRDKCDRDGVAFFYKQSAAMRPGTLPILDGIKYAQFPVVPEML